jgi:hypothetical protein
MTNVYNPGEQICREHDNCRCLEALASVADKLLEQNWQEESHSEIIDHSIVRIEKDRYEALTDKTMQMAVPWHKNIAE